MNGKTIVEQWRHVFMHSNVAYWDAVVACIDTALAQARAEEREACARLVEEALVPQDCDTDDMKQLAEDIRARTL